MKLGADRIDVSVVVPAFNESEGLPHFVEALDRVLAPLGVRAELVIVNDAPRTYRRQEREISRVTLRPLEHTTDIELGAKSRRFEKWLARLDTKRSKE